MRGQIDRDRFKLAYAMSIDRHPLLRASVELDRRDRPFWVAAHKIIPLQWHVEGEAPAVLNYDQLDSQDAGFISNETIFPIDLTQTNGIRCSVIEGDDHIRLFGQFHHSCCDGLGAFRFLSDLLKTYALMSGNGRTRSLPQIDPTWLSMHRRTRYKLSTKLNYMREILRMPFRGLASLLPANERSWVAPPCDAPTSVVKVFDREATTALRAAAKKRGMSLYIQMLCDYHWTLDQFRKSHVADRSENDWIRLVAPVSLRESTEDSLHAHNCVSAFMLDRRHRDIDDPEQHALWVQAEIKRQLGRRLLHGLVWYQSLGLSTFKTAMRKLCSELTVTSTLTDMSYGWRYFSLPKGDDQSYIVCDDLTVEHMDCLAPLRPGTVVAVCTMICGGELRVVFHYDNRFMTRGQLDDLIVRFTERLCRDIQLPSEESIAAAQDYPVK